MRCSLHPFGHVSAAAPGFCAYCDFSFSIFFNASDGFLQAQLTQLRDPLRFSPFLEKGAFSCFPGGRKQEMTQLNVPSGNIKCTLEQSPCFPSPRCLILRMAALWAIPVVFMGWGGGWM